MRFIRQINWTELSGLLVGVFFAIAMIVFGVTLYAKLSSSGIIGVEEYKLYSDFEKALGLRSGTKIQISGVDIGRISNIDIQEKGVRLEFTIRSEFQNWITDSASVFAIRDQNVISARVVNIETKKGVGRVLEDGDFLSAGKAQDLETVLETTNELLMRVNLLVDAADTLVKMVLDTGTTIGALLGSRHLYDNLNLQLNRLDKMTYAGTHILDAIHLKIPGLFENIDTLTTGARGLLTGLKDLPLQVDKTFNSLDSLLGKVDVLVGDLSGVTFSLDQFIGNSEQTLQNAEDLLTGLSNIWIINRSIPKKDSIPFIVESLW
jgi:phospholipid/cholesterol/gamma-HCH transport system substrate-binding protein